LEQVFDEYEAYKVRSTHYRSSSPSSVDVYRAGMLGKLEMYPPVVAMLAHIKAHSQNLNVVEIGPDILGTVVLGYLKGVGFDVTGLGLGFDDDFANKVGVDIFRDRWENLQTYADNSSFDVIYTVFMNNPSKGSGLPTWKYYSMLCDNMDKVLPISGCFINRSIYPGDDLFDGEGFIKKGYDFLDIARPKSDFSGGRVRIYQKII
jgi:hypothetical protein